MPCVTYVTGLCVTHLTGSYHLEIALTEEEMLRSTSGEMRFLSMGDSSSRTMIASQA